MKKCYKAPEVVVVDLDIESICTTQSPINGSGHEADAAQYRESYRSSLWND